MSKDVSDLLNPIFVSEQESSHASSAITGTTTTTRRQPPLMASSISLLPPEILNARHDFSNQGLSDAEIRKRESAVAFSKFNFHPVPPVRANHIVKRRLSSPEHSLFNSRRDFSRVSNKNSDNNNKNGDNNIFSFDAPIDQTYTRNNRFDQAFSTSSSNPQELAKAPNYNYSLRNSNNQIPNVTLRPVSELLDRFRPLFSFNLFNAVQTQCIDTALYSNENFVVSAPTGAGKTVIFELAMINLLMQNTGAKMVYMAPTKALCSERSRDWQRKFKAIGVSCGELTGDTNQAHVNDIKRCDIIVTTPEKWDSMTRRWKDHGHLLELLKLFMIDEVHMLKEKRGATLEAVVSRMKTMGNDIRFVALSATVPNVDDVASWIGSNTGRSAKVLHFGEEYRPVRLVRHVLPFPMENRNAYLFDKKLDYKLLDLIQNYSNNKSTLIFCATRKSTEAACNALIKQIQESGHRLAIKPHSRIITNKDKKLQDICRHGVAYHHAGLDTEDRKLIESLFISGAIQVVCTTSTLAVGVNLPAHLVIIKSTLTWNNQQYVEYSDLEILQMLGRAGRPQFDDSGVAVIMTSNEMRDKYENLVSGTELLESSLHENLTEHLNAEISLGTIHHIDAAMAWLRSTFLYVRIKSNPTYYKMSTDEGGVEQQQDHQNFEKQLEDICAKDLDILHDSGMIVRTDDNLNITEYGEAMAKYYMKYRTMEEIVNLPRMSSLSNLLEMLSKAAEFSDLRCHQGEKQVLNNLNKHPQIRYPIKGKVTRVDHKVYVMIQCILGHIAFSDPKMGFQMNIDANIILQHCPRIMNCIVECMVQKKDVIALRNAINLARCLRARTWENSPFILRQIDGIGQQYARHFANAGIQTFLQLENCDPRRIEMIIGRNPPFGNQIHDALASIPRFKLDISKYSEYNQPTEIELFIDINLTNQKIKTNDNGMSLFATFLAATSDNMFLDYRRFPIFKAQQGYKFRFKVKLTRPNQLIHCSVMLEDYVGLDVSQSVAPEMDSTISNFTSTIPAFLNQGSVWPSPNQAILNESNNFFNNNNVGNNEVLMSQEHQHDMNLEYSHNQDQIGGDSQDIEVIEISFMQGQRKVSFYNFLSGKIRLSSTKTNNYHRCAHECCKVGCRHKPKKRKLQSTSANTSMEINNPEEKKIKSNDQTSISSSSTHPTSQVQQKDDFHQDINHLDYNDKENQDLMTSFQDENYDLFDDYNDNFNEQISTSNDYRAQSIHQASLSDNNPFKKSLSVNNVCQPDNNPFKTSLSVNNVCQYDNNPFRTKQFANSVCQSDNDPFQTSPGGCNSTIGSSPQNPLKIIDDFAAPLSEPNKLHNNMHKSNEASPTNLKRAKSLLPAEQPHFTNTPNFSSSNSFSFFDTKPRSITTTSQNSPPNDYQNNYRNNNETVSNSHIIDKYHGTTLYSDDSKKQSEQQHPDTIYLGHNVNSFTSKEKSLVDETRGIPHPRGGFGMDFLTWLNNHTTSSQAAKTTEENHKQNRRSKEGKNLNGDGKPELPAFEWQVSSDGSPSLGDSITEASTTVTPPVDAKRKSPLTKTIVNVNPTKLKRSLTHSESGKIRLLNILENETTCTKFREYLVSQYCDENLDFYEDVSQYRSIFNASSDTYPYTDSEEIAAFAVHIFETYLDEDISSKPLNVPQDMKTACQRQIESKNTLIPPRKSLSSGSLRSRFSSSTTIISLLENHRTGRNSVSLGSGSSFITTNQRMSLVGVSISNITRRILTRRRDSTCSVSSQTSSSGTCSPSKRLSAMPGSYPSLSPENKHDSGCASIDHEDFNDCSQFDNPLPPTPPPVPSILRRNVSTPNLHSTATQDAPSLSSSSSSIRSSASTSTTTITNNDKNNLTIFDNLEPPPLPPRIPFSSQVVYLNSNILNKTLPPTPEHVTA
ncbi:521_t:CDS:10 [Ambispora gerdemannii]|uniref:DNA 3'-5' helicase n=1 Tax=Ambispora gerdemannii TaxID=144530 RepID=A0A9N8UYJ0_9GLOM|nr:521_t:CDS:10 [Ambispora gerdemannii]